MNKPQLTKLVKEHLSLINLQSITEAEQQLNPEQWQSFWEVIADRLIESAHTEIKEENYREWAPDQAWDQAWTVIERVYPQTRSQKIKISDC